MRKFNKKYQDSQFVHEVLISLTLPHNMNFIVRISMQRTTMFYLKHAIENDWSRNIIIMQMQ